MDEVNSLKKQGNNAFQAGHFDQAAEYYLKAIGLTDDNSTLAILYSNRAQALLNQKKYLEARADSNLSLKYDPNFKKSILRRATANYELKCYSEAATDLREIRRREPRNSAAYALMKHIYPKAKLSTHFFNIYSNYFVRRIQNMPCGSTKLEDALYLDKLAYLIQRQVFVSTRSAAALRYIFDGVEITDVGSPSLFTLKMPASFRIKCSNLAFRQSILRLTTLVARIGSLLSATEPKNAVLFVTTEKASEICGRFCQFSDICCTYEIMHCVANRELKDFSVIRGNANSLTIMPYFPQLLTLKDTTFPHVHSLFIFGDNVPENGFFELWIRRQWKIRTLIFETLMPDVSVLLKFNKIISSQAVKLYLPLLDPKNNRFRIAGLKKDMSTLKLFFPSLNDVCCKAVMRYNQAEFPALCDGKLQQNINLLAKKIGPELKPKWCSKLKVLLVFLIMFEEGGTFEIDVQLLSNVVDQLKKSSNLLKSVRFYEHFLKTFDWYPFKVFAPAIEFSTECADYQIVFEKDLKFTRKSEQIHIYRRCN